MPEISVILDLIYYMDRMLKELVPKLPATTDTDGSVSVLVPSFNQAQFIERTLRSIFEQTLAPNELLVIDDGSSDGSVRVIEAALRDCPFRSELIVRSNHGLSATLNEGSERVASSTFFAYIGSDDVWLPEFLKARVSLLAQRPEAVLAYGNCYSIDENDRIIDCTTEWAAYRDGDVREMLLETLAPLSPSVVYRRSALEARPWNETSRLEDYEMYLKLSAVGEFAFDPSVLAAWRQHSYNISSQLDMMVKEKLAAQRSTAHLFGLTDDQLVQVQRLTRFRMAQEMMRQGRKLDAASMGLWSIGAASSAGEAVRFVGGLLLPHSVTIARRQRSREQAFARYGSIADQARTNP